MPDPADSIDTCIRSRRTHKSFKRLGLSRHDIHALLDLIRWAPNHRMAQPWRCYVMDSNGISALDRYFAEHPHIASWPQPGKEKKLEKLRQVYMANLDLIVHLTAVKDPDPLKDQENYAACSAAAQNLLLGAEARGYASFWASSPAMRHPETQTWLGVDLASEQFVGSLWIGGRCSEPNVPERHDIDAFVKWIQ